MSRHLEGNKLIIVPDNVRDKRLCEQIEILKQQQIFDFDIQKQERIIEEKLQKLNEFLKEHHYLLMILNKDKN